MALAVRRRTAWLRHGPVPGTLGALWGTPRVTADVHHLTRSSPIVEPQPDVIKLLRDLLAEAEKAEIKGFGFFVVDGADVVSTGWATGCARKNDMVSGAATLQARMMQKQLETVVPVNDPRDPA